MFPIGSNSSGFVFIFLLYSVLTCPTEYSWSIEILSLYWKYHQRFPQHHELLLCNVDTTDEEIELFFYRAEHALENGQPPETYTLVHPENLAMQQQQLLKELAKKSLKGVIAILVSSDVSGFFNISPVPPIQVPVISPSRLQNYVQQHCIVNKLHVEVVYSSNPGTGKTYYIDHAVPERSPVMFYNSSTLPQVLKNLEDSTCKSVFLGISSEASFDHNPSTTSWNDIDNFLFCLIILGIVVDQHNNIHYTQFDTRFCIEVSNGSKQSAPPLHTSFLSLLPQHPVDIGELPVDKALQLAWKDTFATRITDLIPTRPLLDAVSTTKFLTIILEKLNKSPGFQKVQQKASSIVQEQLLHFMLNFFFQQRAKQLLVADQPIITLGKDNKTKFFVLSVSLGQLNSPTGIPNIALANKSSKELSEVLQILFPTKGLVIDPHFILTSDNVLKLALLKVLVACDIPVIFQGETGSGKTKLVECFGLVTNIPVHTLDMHGGIGEEEIIKFINKVMPPPDGLAILFLDEINTSPAVELVKELVCDKSCRGIPLSGNLRVVAACNPLVSIASLASPLSSDTTLPPFLVPSGKASSLKYNVRPLHGTLEKYVIDFGIMNDHVEVEYIIYCSITPIDYF